MAGYIILFVNDADGVSVPFGWDDDCDGAVCCYSKEVAYFETRQAARKAIEISTNWAKLRRSMNDTFNEDFTSAACRKCIKIVPLRAAK